MNKAKIFGLLSPIVLATGTLLAQSGVFTKDDTSSTPWQVIISGASNPNLQLIEGVNTSAAPFVSLQGFAQSIGPLTMVLQNVGGRVGIGTEAPTSALTVRADASPSSFAQLELTPPSGGASSTSFVSKVRFRATFDAYPADQTPRVAAQLQAGYNGGVWGTEYLSFQVGNSDDASRDPSEKMRITAAGNVGIGTTNPTQKLSVNGTIRAKEVIVDTGWSDYVFAPDYRLAPLSEVEQHIRAEGHLPGIPSAAEVAGHGVTMGEMQAKLLAKNEELTLHQIDQEKRISAQNAVIIELPAKNADLQRRLKYAGF